MMKIWPWSKIKELKQCNDGLVEDNENLHESVAYYEDKVDRIKRENELLREIHDKDQKMLKLTVVPGWRGSLVVEKRPFYMDSCDFCSCGDVSVKHLEIPLQEITKQVNIGVRFFGDPTLLRKILDDELDRFVAELVEKTGFGNE